MHGRLRRPHRLAPRTGRRKPLTALPSNNRIIEAPPSVPGATPGLIDAPRCRPTTCSMLLSPSGAAAGCHTAAASGRAPASAATCRLGPSRPVLPERGLHQGRRVRRLRYLSTWHRAGQDAQAVGACRSAVAAAAGPTLRPAAVGPRWCGSRRLGDGGHAGTLPRGKLKRVRAGAIVHGAGQHGKSITRQQSCRRTRWRRCHQRSCHLDDGAGSARYDKAVANPAVDQHAGMR